MRLFLAVELDPAIRDALVGARDRLAAAVREVRWVATGSLHVTVKFCGELEGPDALVRETEPEVAAFAPFECEVAGIGQFPLKGPPKVIWAGCGRDGGALASLAGAIERGAERAGVPREDRAFTAHVTLGRATGRPDWRALAQAAREIAAAPFGRQRVAAVTLFQSTLTPEGPIYAALRRIPLAGTRRE
jgi:2'-5' RNA ligase